MSLTPWHYWRLTVKLPTETDETSYSTCTREIRSYCPAISRTAASSCSWCLPCFSSAIKEADWCGCWRREQLYLCCSQGSGAAGARSSRCWAGTGPRRSHWAAPQSRCPPPEDDKTVDVQTLHSLSSQSTPLRISLHACLTAVHCMTANYS